MSRAEQSSDALPFTQVDRAVKAKAALLAGYIATTVQHALGSLVEFWDLCSDPRELEVILAETPPEREPELVLTADDVGLRFHLASGHKVDPVVLANLGFLEPVGDQYRVRGMSRQFSTVGGRLSRRRAAQEAGKRSAETRRARSGTAQPRSQVVDEALSIVRTLPERPPNDARTSTERQSNPEDRGQRTEDREKNVVRTAPPPVHVVAVVEPPPATSDPEGWTSDEFWRWAQGRRQASKLVPEKPPHPAKLGAWWAAARALVPVVGLQEAFYRFAADPHWERSTPAAPFAGFLAQWERFVPQGYANQGSAHGG